MTEKYTKDDLIAKAREIAHMIANTEQVEIYKEAEAQINQNQFVREKIASLKALQKQAVNFQHLGKERGLKMIEGKIEKIEEEIDAIPVVQQFKAVQMDVNELLQLVSNTIANEVTDEIVVSTGGNKLTGETGSYVENSAGGCS
ncbi:hypothetical protein GCM10007425_16100 [Lysinibacillus alkalisoli]|uniref:Master regulator for biofilm formation n=1 Tax=Lysinibacillus alkalisoli TaxID=1911548 RepID=A0A917G4H8_9BACI|nr:YlbF family regulator [Lysinibacillus alkalisoli]GGG22425.1 hypothetical protein GCM10007425_16100 [Lysinibacillus alkalisoli]